MKWKSKPTHPIVYMYYDNKKLKSRNSPSPALHSALDPWIVTLKGGRELFYTQIILQIVLFCFKYTIWSSWRRFFLAQKEIVTLQVYLQYY